MNLTMVYLWLKKYPLKTFFGSTFFCYLDLESPLYKFSDDFDDNVFIHVHEQ